MPKKADFHNNLVRPTCNSDAVSYVKVSTWLGLKSAFLLCSRSEFCVSSGVLRSWEPPHKCLAAGLPVVGRSGGSRGSSPARTGSAALGREQPGNVPDTARTQAQIVQGPGSASRPFPLPDF